MNVYHPYTIFPLGDSALTIDFGNFIYEEINKKVLRLFHHLKNTDHPFIVDLVPAYSSLTICYQLSSIDRQKTSFETMADIIEELIVNAQDHSESEPNCFRIPVCYSKKFALDVDYLAIKNNLSVEEIIQIHTSKTYRVYMLGFLPGFTYMGEVDERIAIARKPTPRTKVFAGAVGIAGRQTGIYPLESPGGWQIIGRTPLQVFNKNEEQPVLLQPGDEVKFYSISEDEFANYQTGNS
jgi:inhibitor of KinA